MSKSVFISCVFEDSYRLETIKKWVVSNRLGDVTITHETEDNRILGQQAIKKHIKSKIEGAAFIFVLVGNDTHNHNWIAAEIELANSFHKEIICIRLPQSAGGVPDLLSNKKLIAFEPNAIKKAIT